MKSFKGGKTVFTFPPQPFKCGGAPQKIAYLSEAYWRKSGVRENTTMNYYAQGPALFMPKHYGDLLNAIMKKKGINVNLNMNLHEIKPKKQLAIFKN